jgi:hypothetical protein
MVIALDLAARNGDDLSDDGPERAAVAAKLDRDHAGHETHPHAAICSLPGNEASGRGKDGDQEIRCICEKARTANQEVKFKLGHYRDFGTHTSPAHQG